MEGPHTTPYTVLIVDDHPALLDAFVQGLPLIGPFTVLTAEDGTQGLECYFQHRPECVVIDIKMPRLDGYQLARALRGDPDSSGTPLIFLTALGQDPDRLAGLLTGVDRYLVKPVLPSELAVVIEEVCAISQGERQRRLRSLLDESSRD